MAGFQLSETIFKRQYLKVMEKKKSARNVTYINFPTYTALIFSAIIFTTSPNFRDDFFKVLNKFWLAAGELRQAQWNWFLSYTGDDAIWLYRYCSVWVFIGTYWFVGAIFMFIDLTNQPAALRKYKVQPGTNEPIDKKKLIPVIANVIRNQTVVTFPVAYIISKITEWRGIPPVRELPAFHWTALEILFLALAEEIALYYTHRLAHHKRVYKYIHKQHHEWTAPIGIAAVYGHPVEHIVVNVFPAIIGVLILNSHISTALMWFGVVVAFTVIVHSGYHLPFSPSPEFHDFHHAKFNNNFGVLGILDYLHGTDALFRKTMSFPRHRLITQIMPARELYPDSIEVSRKGRN